MNQGAWCSSKQTRTSLAGADGDAVLQSPEPLVDFGGEEVPRRVRRSARPGDGAPTLRSTSGAVHKSGKLSLATKKYDKALRYVEHDHAFSDDEKRETKKIKLSLYLNGAFGRARRRS